MKYILTSRALAGEIVFHFSADGHLSRVDMPHMSEAQQTWLSLNLPWTESAIEALRKASPTISIVKVAISLDFQTIWDRYSHKVGDQKRAQKLWAALQDSERLACLASLKRYDEYLARTGIAKCLLTTYLNQRRWENLY